jgi:hypothetical protein
MCRGLRRIFSSGDGRMVMRILGTTGSCPSIRSRSYFWCICVCCVSMCVWICMNRYGATGSCPSIRFRSYFWCICVCMYQCVYGCVWIGMGLRARVRLSYPGRISGVCFRGCLRVYICMCWYGLTDSCLPYGPGPMYIDSDLPAPFPPKYPQLSDWTKNTKIRHSPVLSLPK